MRNATIAAKKTGKGQNVKDFSEAALPEPDERIARMLYSQKPGEIPLLEVCTALNHIEAAKLQKGKAGQEACNDVLMGVKRAVALAIEDGLSAKPAANERALAFFREVSAQSRVKGREQNLLIGIAVREAVAALARATDEALLIGGKSGSEIQEDRDQVIKAAKIVFALGNPTSARLIRAVSGVFKEENVFKWGTESLDGMAARLERNAEKKK
ncbi:Uncharacterised protein [uncultured archaeon]|nr:Uncharacterised protein [uncultured archaeon]